MATAQRFPAQYRPGPEVIAGIDLTPMVRSNASRVDSHDPAVSTADIEQELWLHALRKKRCATTRCEGDSGRLAAYLARAIRRKAIDIARRTNRIGATRAQPLDSEQTSRSVFSDGREHLNECRNRLQMQILQLASVCLSDYERHLLRVISQSARPAREIALDLGLSDPARLYKRRHRLIRKMRDLVRNLQSVPDSELPRSTAKILTEIQRVQETLGHAPAV